MIVIEVNKEDHKLEPPLANGSSLHDWLEGVSQDKLNLNSDTENKKPNLPTVDAIQDVRVLISSWKEIDTYCQPLS